MRVWVAATGQEAATLVGLRGNPGIRPVQPRGTLDLLNEGSRLKAWETPTTGIEELNGTAHAHLTPTSRTASSSPVALSSGQKATNRLPRLSGGKAIPWLFSKRDRSSGWTSRIR